MIAYAFLNHFSIHEIARLPMITDKSITVKLNASRARLSASLVWFVHGRSDRWLILFFICSPPRLPVKGWGRGTGGGGTVSFARRYIGSLPTLGFNLKNTNDFVKPKKIPVNVAIPQKISRLYIATNDVDKKIAIQIVELKRRLFA